MGAIASFDPNAWLSRYPEFAGIVSPAQAQGYFSEATLYLANDGSGPVKDAGQQLALLGMLVAHIAALNAAQPKAGGQPMQPLVGRISGATEGSVSVQIQNDYPPGTAQWYQTTRYGSAFWAATAGYRTMRYRVPACAPFGRFPGFGSFGFRWPF
jgi:hypothetical protein